MEESDILWQVKRDSIRRMIANKKRIDERKFDEYRKIELYPNYVPKAEGSCLIKLGKTQVLVGVKMSVGEPYPDTPDEGVIVTNAELVPLASPVFYAGPPNEDTIEIARVVDRGLRESKMIELENLVVESGEKVWSVLIDIHVLDHDGNLIDASAIAATKALLTTMIPKYEDEKVLYGEKDKPLPVRDKPVSSTFAKIGGYNVLDPILEETKVMDARLTFVTNHYENLCAMQKSGQESYTKTEVDEMFDIAVAEGKKIRKLY